MWNLYPPVINLDHLLHTLSVPTLNLQPHNKTLLLLFKLLLVDCLCCTVTFFFGHSIVAAPLLAPFGVFAYRLEQVVEFR